MSGGVRGVRSNAAPISIIVIMRLLRGVLFTLKPSGERNYKCNEHEATPTEEKQQCRTTACRPFIARREVTAFNDSEN